MNRLFSVLCLCVLLSGVGTQAQTKIDATHELAYCSQVAKAQAALQSADDYRLAGPYTVIARDGQYAYTKGGSERDMYTAWQAARQGDTATARRIIDAYARTLQRIEGHDAPLCLIQCYWLVRAMMETDGHTSADTALQ